MRPRNTADRDQRENPKLPKKHVDKHYRPTMIKKWVEQLRGVFHCFPTQFFGVSRCAMVVTR